MMLIIRKSLFAVLILVMLATASVAEARDTFYIAPSQVALSKVIQPPPANSQAQKDDLKAVQAAQKTRTEAQIKTALADNSVLTVFFANDVLGPNFTKENLKIAAPFFDRVFADQIEACLEIKEHFNRQRPFVIDPEIKPIYQQSANPSFPSGHATTGYVYTIILSMMVPEKTQELYDRAEAYGRNRVIAGVHFPTDVEAGRVSAAVIVNALIQQPLFMRDFERAKKEIRKVLDLK
ncbi:MAG TPA: phosphatase PAP2 family protein [Syntrophorhabdaceae bacterium]|nr:phosphatase PAP2 family protein [Syntrophorhabdaceae bacterium]